MSTTKRQLAGERVRLSVPSLGRVRWITKLRVLRRQWMPWAKRHPWRALAYVPDVRRAMGELDVTGWS